MSLSNELYERGLIYQYSGESLEQILDEDKRVAYIGVDPTADSIHVGNLITYIFAERLVRAGHKVILLVGGATGLIGDPSGKDRERLLSSEIDVCERTKFISKQISSLPGLSKLQIVNNFDWYKNMTTIEFLRDVGKFFTVNAMIKKESVSRRIASEDGISYTEFSYVILQSYDFHHLNAKHDCNLQIGGSDQWGNIISGIDFIRKKTGNTVYGVTIPLIVDKNTGRKFGKSEGNAIWLDPKKTSYYDFYQFWLGVSDASVMEYLKLFTFITLKEISNIQKTVLKSPNLRTAQKLLAYEVTVFVHGKLIADDIKNVTELMYGDIEISDMNVTNLALINKYVPVSYITKDTNIIDILVDNNYASSKRQAREFLKNGAIRINGQKINFEIDVSKIYSKNNIMIISRGNKQKRIFKIK